jgi:hypothetical protein
VAEGLRGVAQLSSHSRIPLFAEQSDVVAQAEKSFEQPGGLGLSAGEVQRVDKPERAGDEEPFPAGQAIVGGGVLVPLDQAVLGQLLLDGGDRAPSTRGSVPGRNPTRGMSSRLASSPDAPEDWTKLLRSAF